MACDAGLAKAANASEEPGQRVVAARELAAERSGTRGSDQRMVGMWSWSRSAGVSRVRRTMKWAEASGPMPPRTPRVGVVMGGV